MGDRINLDSYAEGCISDAIYGMDQLDLDRLREEADEQVHSAADNACIYTSHCTAIINDYERDVGDVEDLGGTYRADQWQDAMQAYAYSVAREYLGAKVNELLSDVEEAADALRDAANEWAEGDTDANGDPIEFDEPRITSDCPHGWAAHKKEDEGGVHYWLPDELEGCKAVAVEAAGIWLSYTWTAKGGTP